MKMSEMLVFYFRIRMGTLISFFLFDKPGMPPIPLGSDLYVQIHKDPDPVTAQVRAADLFNVHPEAVEEVTEAEYNAGRAKMHRDGPTNRC